MSEKFTNTTMNVFLGRCLGPTFIILFFVSISSAAIDVNADYEAGYYSDLSMHFDASEMVETASRYPKPITEVAENFTVITAREIEAMHVHSVAEVLEQIAGATVFFFGHDFIGGDQLQIHGSREWRTLVLIDGVRYNNASGGDGITNGIPLQIIKKIEVIKGPASAVWGSSLGGVVNIITKDPGGMDKPSGNIVASYGEANSWVTEGDIFGTASSLDYYLYAGRYNSDGLWHDRFYENRPLFGKIAMDLPRKMRLSLSIGQSDPAYKGIELVSADVVEYLANRSTFATISLNAPINSQANLYVAGQLFRQDYSQDRNRLTTGGQLTDFIWDEETYSFEGRFNWWHENWSAVIGAETSRSTMDYTLVWLGNPFVADPAFEEKRGLYANFTWKWQDISVTPGIRYDYHSISDEFVSPSIGLTYMASPNNLFRASISHGFSYPYLALTSGGNFFQPVNPNLKPEKIWAYQAGVENTSLGYLLFKVNLFQHDIDDVFNASSPWTNVGTERLQGIEAEIETIPWHYCSLTSNFSYTRTDNDERQNDKIYRANLAVDYNDFSGWKARLSGNYSWWYERETVGRQSKSDPIWDFSLIRSFDLPSFRELQLSFSVRNICNGSQYWDSDYRNPGRWLEAGIRFRF